MTEKLFLEMEVSFGEIFFSHLAGYITAAKHGLTEMELLDIMSCDQKARKKIDLFCARSVSCLRFNILGYGSCEQEMV